MGFGQVALGLASIALGLNSLRSGVNRLSNASAPRQSHAQHTYRHAKNTRSHGLSRAFAGDQTVPVPGRPFQQSGYHNVRGANGQQVPMQMRSFNIRTLDDRINYLRRLVDTGKRDPQVYGFARRSVSKKCGGAWCVSEKDNLAEAKAVFGAIQAGRHSQDAQARADLETARGLFKSIRRNVRYTSDIAGVDTYQKPAHTLALKTADCDDYSSLTCSALQSVGIPCRFKVIRTKGSAEWNHIYPQAGFPRQKPVKWVSMDSSVNMPFGWEAPGRMVDAKRVFAVG